MDHGLLVKQLISLSSGVPQRVSVLANASALLYDSLADINWAGFYLTKENVLWLGPFQGKPACVRIPFGKGVCGAAAATGETQLVPDVHAFKEHIACDCASNAEIVVPLFVNGALFGVLDIDSPTLGRFTAEDQIGLEAFARALERILEGE